MPCVVHDEGSFLHDFIDVSVDVGIIAACGGLLHGVTVPVDALIVVVGEFLLHVGQYILCIFHVDVGLVVIAHQTDGVLPCASIGVGHVVDEFVHHILGICFCRYRQAAHTAVGQFLEWRDTFSVGKQCEVLFHHIRVCV